MWWNLWQSNQLEKSKGVENGKSRDEKYLTITIAIWEKRVLEADSPATEWGNMCNVLSLAAGGDCWLANTIEIQYNNNANTDNYNIRRTWETTLFAFNIWKAIYIYSDLNSTWAKCSVNIELWEGDTIQHPTQGYREVQRGTERYTGVHKSGWHTGGY